MRSDYQERRSQSRCYVLDSLAVTITTVITATVTTIIITSSTVVIPIIAVVSASLDQTIVSSRLYEPHGLR